MASHKPRWTLIAMILGSAMAFIDGTVVNIALPVLQKSLGATVKDAQWIVDAYLLVHSSLLLVGGSLGDRLGRRRVFAVGVVIFAAASAWCGAAPDPRHLIVARAIQGLGAALLVPGSLAIITATFPAGERGKAIGTWAAFTSLAAVAGPLLGGWLVQAISWRAIFFINVPLAALTLGFVFFGMDPDEPSAKHERLDWTGTFLIAAGLGAITFSLIEAPERGWLSPLVVGAAAAGVIALVIFIFVERKTANPIVPLALFRSRTFTGANVLTLLLYAALSAATFLLPFNLIQLQHYSPAEAGAAFLPFVASMSLLSRWTGALADKVGPRPLMIFGPIMAGSGFALMALPGIGGSYWTTFFPAVLILGVGMAVTVVPLTTTVMNAIPSEEFAGSASGINNTVARVGGLLAIALFGAISVIVFSQTLDAQLAARGASPQMRQEMARQTLRLEDAAPPKDADAQTRKMVHDAIDISFLRAFRINMFAAAALAAASAAGALMIGRVKKKGAHTRTSRVSSPA